MCPQYPLYHQTAFADAILARNLEIRVRSSFCEFRKSASVPTGDDSHRIPRFQYITRDVLESSLVQYTPVCTISSWFYMKFHEFVVSQRDTLCRGPPTPSLRRSLRLTPCITKVFSYPELAQNFGKVNTLGGDSCTTPLSNRVWLHDREMVFVPGIVSLFTRRS